MRLNFCTLFDTYYLSRGIALYESLKIHCEDFHLFVFAFDDKTYSILKEEKFDNMTVISLKEFENERLLSVKNDRTIGEYCWTCTGSTIKYCIETFFLEHCTYLDADLYFFSNPIFLFNEVLDGKILITEHRYTKKYDQSKSSGKYCVQFMTFFNNKDSLVVLNEWIDDCINWCYARAENGKFGDQKYLDNWNIKYKNIHELKHLGGGVAPWNIQQYKIRTENNRVLLEYEDNNITFNLIFYHFHALKFLSYEVINLAPYSLNKDVVDLIYKPYVEHLKKIECKYLIDVSSDNILKKRKTIKYFLNRILEDKSLLIRVLKQKIFEKSNIYKIKEIIGEK